MSKYDRWTPVYERWRHGGWYVLNVRYPSGAVGCVSNNYQDKKWRIVCDDTPFDERQTYKTRDAAARAEKAKAESAWTANDERSALKQGWGLFDCDASGIVVIQKMDDPPIHSLWEEGFPEAEVFDSDAAAIRFVRKQAAAGDSTCAKAVAVHDSNKARLRAYRRRMSRS